MKPRYSYLTALHQNTHNLVEIAVDIHMLLIHLLSFLSVSCITWFWSFNNACVFHWGLLQKWWRAWRNKSEGTQQNVNTGHKRYIWNHKLKWSLWWPLVRRSVLTPRCKWGLGFFQWIWASTTWHCFYNASGRTTWLIRFKPV